MDAAAEDIAFVPVWGLDGDPKIVGDVKRLWTGANLRPDVIANRSNELCAVAYCGDELAAVSTANIIYEPVLRNRLFGFRSLTAAQFRQRRLAWRITAYSFHLLQEWAAKHPEERILGTMLYIETDKYKTGLLHPVRDGFGITLHFVGYNSAGQQMRVAWFDHATLDDEAAKSRPPPPPDTMG